jgi:hypothetical protein
MKMHEVTVNEPYGWQAPDGSKKILTEGLGLVHGSPRFQVPKAMYLLRVVRPFEVEGETVRQLLVSPRYSGDAVEAAMSSDCTVGIGRVRPGVPFEAGDEFDGSESVYWAIGSIKPFDE